MADPKLIPHWWDAKDAEEASTSVGMLSENLKRAQQHRRRQFVASARLYSNSAALGVLGNLSFGAPWTGFAAREQVSYNAVQPVCDTVHAKVITTRPRPYALTSGGTWAQRSRAKKVNKFLDGLFFEADVYANGERALLDGVVFGDGLLHPYLDKEGMQVERVTPSELWVDELEAIEGNARQLYRQRFVDRDQLKQMFPGHDAMIDKADGPLPSEYGHISAVANVATVTECWHLPSGPDADDGRHLIRVSTGPLTDLEPWTHDFFPFARVGFAPRLAGYWHQGLAEILQAKQLEVVRVSWLIQRAINTMGGFKIWNPAGSGIPDDHFTDDADSILTGTVKPEYLTPPAVSDQLYQWRRDLVREMYEEAGVSQQAASSQKPAGITAGVALRTLDDMQTERFTRLVKGYERMYVDLARMCIALLAKKRGGITVRAPSGKTVELVNWADVKLDIKDFVLQVFPTNALRKDPAGRLQDVVEMLQAGLLNPFTAQKLLDFPDLEAQNVLLTSAEEYISKILDALCDDGIYTPPTKYDDLQRCVEMGLAYHNWGRASELEPERLAMLRDFIDTAQRLLKPPALPAPGPALPAAPAMPGTPVAAPMPAPRSDLMPMRPAA